MANKKVALCIGINNYPGTDNDLSGCVNDANDWTKELGSRGFAVTQLIDKAATKDAIRKGMLGLLESTASGDVVVFTYSGHGTWDVDIDGDEPDKRDEALCPWDMDAGPLLDDELYDIFATRNRGTRVIFLSDSCHSGTAVRYNRHHDDRRKIRFLNPEYYKKNQAPDVRRALVAAQKAPARGKARTSALLISGCGDLEYSYDAVFDNRPNGAFTRVALDILREKKPATYRDWHKLIRERLPSTSYPQTPNLMASSTQKGWPVFE